MDDRLRTNVPGLSVAGCLTPVTCQMMIAAGQWAITPQPHQPGSIRRESSTAQVAAFWGSDSRQQPSNLSFTATKSSVYMQLCG